MKQPSEERVEKPVRKLVQKLALGEGPYITDGNFRATYRLSTDRDVRVADVQVVPPNTRSLGGLDLCIIIAREVQMPGDQSGRGTRRESLRQIRGRESLLRHFTW